MMRRTVWIGVVAVAAAAWGQDLEQRVSYAGPATTAQQFLELLGTQTGLSLTTSPQTANEVLIVKAQDVKLMDLLKRVADVCAAEWKQETGGYRLVRPEALAREQSNADALARAKAFEGPLLKLLEGVNKEPAIDAAQAQRMAESARQVQENLRTPGQFSLRSGATRSPAARALVRLLASLSPATLAAIAPNTRVVFASAPNRMQRTLGSRSNAILATLLREHNTYAQALAETPRETPPPNTRILILGGPDLSAQSIDRIGKALVVVTRGSDDGLSAELKVADSTGAIVARANQYLAPDRPVATTRGAEAAKPLTLSANAKEYATLMAGPATPQGDGRQVVRLSIAGANVAFSSASPPTPNVADEWRQRLAQPEKFEPHEFVGGEVLRAVAAAEELQLVANVPDAALIPMCRRLLNAQLTPGQLLGYLEVDLDLGVKREDGWLQIAPRHPSEVRDARIDRASLGLILRTALKNGYVRLDEMAAYALRQPDGLPDGTFDERTIRLLSPDAGADFGFNATDRRAMLKLYGLMGAPQRRLLVQGGAIQLGALDPRQAALLHQMVFHSSGGPSIRNPGGQGQRGPQRPAQQQAQEFNVVAIAAAPGSGQGGLPLFGGSFDTALIEERTEALPLGVPADGVLTMRLDQQQGVLGTRADGSDAKFMSADQLAGDLAQADNPQLAAISGGNSGPYAKFRPAALTQYDFQFRLSVLAEMGRRLRDAYLAQGTEASSFDNLPASFRNEVLQIRQRLSEAANQMRLDGPVRRGGRRGPPPP